MGGAGRGGAGDGEGLLALSGGGPDERDGRRRSSRLREVGGALGKR